jgi:hypothetical protein
LTFTASGALFQQTAEQLQQRLGDRYDASKNYPQYDGIMNIRLIKRMRLLSIS